MKFKVGDKVKILSYALDINVAPSEIGKAGVIVEIFYESIYVKTDSKEYGSWSVREQDIGSVIKKGEQLLFSFMDEKE